MLGPVAISDSYFSQGIHPLPAVSVLICTPIDFVEETARESAYTIVASSIGDFNVRYPATSNLPFASYLMDLKLWNLLFTPVYQAR